MHPAVVASAVAAALATAAGVRADDASRLVSSSGPVTVGAPFPTFAGYDLAGTLVTSRFLFTARPGATPTPVVLSFFATWCKPCKRHLPTLHRAAQAAGARLVLVDFGDEDPGEVREFLGDLGVRGAAVLADKTLAISSRVGVTKALPRTFVLDATGNVTAIFEHEGDDLGTVLAGELSRAAAATHPVVPVVEAR